MTDSITLPETTVRTRPKRDEKTKQLPPYHVILHNDDDHTFDYVIHMMQRLFGHPIEKGHMIATEVHQKGRVIVDTTSKERAELKRDQIHAFGPDPLFEPLPRVDVGVDRTGALILAIFVSSCFGIWVPLSSCGT